MLSSPWIRALDKDVSPEDLENRLINGDIVVRTLRNYLNLRLQESLQLERNADYSEASWSHKQAHLNGSISELSKLIKLLGPDSGP